MKFDITTLKQLDDFSNHFAKELSKGDVVYLHGDLGSGKTTFTQLLLKQLGYEKRVKSPTYAIYETYTLIKTNLVHMDLYRLSSPEELYYLAIDEIFDSENAVIIEWPEKGKGVLPKATKTLYFTLENADNRNLKVDIR